jgi:hypothetical protein
VAISITMSTKEPIEKILTEVRGFASQKGVQVEGDNYKGRFSGQGFEGNYSVNGQNFTIDVTKKPWIVPEGIVKNAIQDYFKDK